MELIIRFFEDDGSFPNSRLPVLIHKGCFDALGAGDPGRYEQLFHENGWGNGWRNGLFNFHHYHSTAHEVLGVYSGWVDAQLGGPGGECIRAEAGDVLILPAGIAHKNLGDGGGFKVVGAYPAGQYPDTKYGDPGDRPAADKAIAAVAVPSSDPVKGISGGILEHWKS